MEPIIRIEHLTHTYSAGTPFQRSAVEDVSLDIMPGEFLGIIGHTGSGKSTLAKTFNGVLLPAGGKVYVEGLDTADAGTATSVTLVFLSALATGLGVYHRLARLAGAGTLVPITGFANAVVSAAIEFKTEGRVLGTGAKMFIIAGPVIVFGTAASVIYGVVLLLFGA